MTEMAGIEAPLRRRGRPPKVSVPGSELEPQRASQSVLEPSERKRVTKPGSKKFAPWEERQLIIDICKMPTYAAVMEKWEVSKTFLQDFRTRHAREIDAVLDDAENEYAGLWIADKAQRLAALQDAYGKLRDGAEAARTKVAIIKEASDQLGQTPNRSPLIAISRVEHLIAGVELQDAFGNRNPDQEIASEEIRAIEHSSDIPYEDEYEEVVTEVVVTDDHEAIH